MKKFLKFLVLLLIVPVTFAFAGCKKDKNDGGNSSGGGQQQEQPADPGAGEGGGESGDEGGGDEQPTDPDDDPENPPSNPGGEGGGDQGGGDNPPVTPEEPEVYYHSVNFDYNLPDGYKHLQTNQKVTKKTTETISLLTVSDAKLNTYFEGWFDKSTDAAVSSAISGTANAEKNVYAKWDVTNLKKYYYTEGLTFGAGTDTEENTVASVTSYVGTAEIVIIPTYYKVDATTEIPVRIFAKNAFENTNVKSLTQSVEGLIVEESAFAGSKLENFDFSKTYRIDANAFAGAKLKTINMGAYVRLMGDYAFANNIDLTSANLSNVTITTTISTGLFSGCSKLSEVVIGTGFRTVSNYAFKDCAKLANIDFISTNITSIGNCAFENCVAVTSATISNSITSFGFNVFNGCTGLVTLKTYKVFSQSETDTLSIFIGDLSATLNKIELLGTGITTIPSRYFENYSNMTEFVMANTVTTIGAYAFAGCTKLETFELPTALDFNNFSINSVSDTLWYKNLSDILYVGDILYLVPEGVSGAVTVKAGTVKILDNAFACNTKITSIILPASISNIGASAFEECSNLTTVTFEANSVLAEIKERTFNRCSSLSSINLDVCSGLTTISDFAFGYISTIANFKLPENLETLSSTAFYNAQISAFEIAATNTNFATENGVVYDKSKTTLVIYPAKKSDVMFEIPSSVTLVKTYAFAYNKVVEYIYVSSEVEFEDYALYETGGGYAALAILTENDQIDMNNNTDAYIYNMLSDVYYTAIDNGNDFDFEVNVGGDDGSYNFFVKFERNSVIYCYQIFVDVSGETSEVVEKINISDLFA